MRHTDAGLAIPDFPLAFGHVIPPHWDAKIAIHFAHRLGAVMASVLIVAAAGHVFYHHRRRPELLRPSLLLLVLLVIQITLGALTVLTARNYIINSLHVVAGASVLVTSLVLTLGAHRSRFAAMQHEAWNIAPIAAGPPSMEMGSGGTRPTHPTRTGARA
jgi:cytochrome c oxidase assembly protein subunit 15